MKKLALEFMAMVVVSVASAQNYDKKQCDKSDNCCKKEQKVTDQCEQQHGQHIGVTPEQRTERMTKRFGLTEEQAQKVLELNKKYASTFGQSMQMGRTGNKRQPKEGMQRQGFGKRKMQQGDSTQCCKVRPELTPEQKEKVEKVKAERKAQREEYRKQLDKILTKEQKEAMKKQLELRQAQKNKKV